METQQARIRDGARRGIEVDLSYGRVDARWLADFLSVRSGEPLHPNGLTIIGAIISGPIDWSGWHFPVSVRFLACRLGAPVRAHRLTVKGDLSFEGSSTTFSLDFSNARVDGDLDLRGLTTVGLPSKIPGEDQPPRVDLTAIRVKGSALLTALSAHGEVGLARAKIGGDLKCSRAKLRNGTEVALNLEKAEISNHVALDDNFSAWGEVNLIGAQIGGDLNCAGAKLHNQGGDVLSADSAKIELCADLGADFEAWGGVRLPSAEIGGQLILSGAYLHNRGGAALTADGARIKRNGAVLEGFQADGEVRFAGAEITGELSFRGAKLHNPEGKALNAANVSVTNDVILGSLTNDAIGERKFEATGKVSFIAAHVGGSLVCGGASLTGATTDEVAFDGRNLTVEGWFAWQTGDPAKGKVLLDRAKVGELRDKLECWPDKQGYLDLTGFVYEQVDSQVKPDPDGRVDWIRLQTGARGDYNPQPYIQLAQVYKAAGNDDEVRKVLIEKQRDLRKFGDLRWYRKTWNLLLGFFIGHGYRIWHAAVAILVVYGLSVGVVWMAMDHNALIPVGPTASNLHGLRVNDCTSRYPCLFPLAYPVDAAVPVINLHQVDYWQFDASTLWGRIGRDSLDLATFFGWALTTMLVVGITGLVRES